LERKISTELFFGDLARWAISDPLGHGPSR
jgi:hypothetical protein